MKIILNCFLSRKEQIQVKKMTKEKSTFSAKCIFMLKNWYIQNPRAQLSLNMYISSIVFYFYAQNTRPITLDWSPCLNFKNTVFCVSCFSLTEVTRSLYYRACTMPLFIGEFYCDAAHSSVNHQDILDFHVSSGQATGIRFVYLTSSKNGDYANMNIIPQKLVF